MDAGGDVYTRGERKALHIMKVTYSVKGSATSAPYSVFCNFRLAKVFQVISVNLKRKRLKYFMHRRRRHASLRLSSFFFFFARDNATENSKWPKSDRDSNTK